MRNKNHLPLMPESEVENLIDWVHEHRRQMETDSNAGNLEARKTIVISSWLAKFAFLPMFDAEDCSHCAELLKSQIEAYEKTDWLPIPEIDDSDPMRQLAEMIARGIASHLGMELAENSAPDLDFDAELENLLKHMGDIDSEKE